MSITVLIGAGSVIDIGGPTTSHITCEIRKKEQSIKRVSFPLINKIAESLEMYYGTESINFEDIFHAIEQISTYVGAWNYGGVKEFRPAFGAFSQPKDFSFFENSYALAQAQVDLINVVAELVDKYDANWFTNPENSWYHDFWRALYKSAHLDIATLNYDGTIEKVLPNLNNGFEKTEHDFARFDPNIFANKNCGGKIMHLHGSIYHGYPRMPNLNQYCLEDNREDLYLYNSFENARKTWFGGSGNTSQSGENATIGPIITGLNKADKLQSSPYIYYSSALVQAIQNNRSLLVIGYSFGDLYVNRIIEKMARIHKDNRRIVFIQQIPEDIIGLSEWSFEMNRGMFSNFAMAFGETHFDNFRFGQLYPETNFYKSENQTACLYTNGFKTTVNEHLNEILAFLGT